jgi:hypothetical protein
MQRLALEMRVFHPSRSSMGIAVGPVSNEVSVVKRVVDTAMGAGAGLYLWSAKVETPDSRRKRPLCFGSTSFISGARDSIRQKRRCHRCRQRNCRLRARNGTLFTEGGTTCDLEARVDFLEIFSHVFPVALRIWTQGPDQA